MTFTSKNIAKWANMRHEDVMRDIRDEIKKIELDGLPIEDFELSNNYYKLTRNGVHQIANKYYVSIKHSILKGLEDIKIPKKVKSCYVYIAEFDSSIVKIGVSVNVEKRLNTLCNQSGRILNRYLAVRLDDGSHFKIENELHKYFHRNRTVGEYFTCSFEESCYQLKKILNLV